MSFLRPYQHKTPKADFELTGLQPQARLLKDSSQNVARKIDYAARVFWAVVQRKDPKLVKKPAPSLEKQRVPFERAAMDKLMGMADLPSHIQQPAHTSILTNVATTTRCRQLPVDETFTVKAAAAISDATTRVSEEIPAYGELNPSDEYVNYAKNYEAIYRMVMKGKGAENNSHFDRMLFIADELLTSTYHGKPDGLDPEKQLAVQKQELAKRFKAGMFNHESIFLQMHPDARVAMRVALLRTLVATGCIEQGDLEEAVRAVNKENAKQNKAPFVVDFSSSASPAKATAPETATRTPPAAFITPELAPTTGAAQAMPQPIVREAFIDVEKANAAAAYTAEVEGQLGNVISQDMIADVYNTLMNKLPLTEEIVQLGQATISKLFENRVFSETMRNKFEHNADEPHPFNADTARELSGIALSPKNMAALRLALITCLVKAGKVTLDDAKSAIGAAVGKVSDGKASVALSTYGSIGRSTLVLTDALGLKLDDLLK